MMQNIVDMAFFLNIDSEEYRHTDIEKEILKCRNIFICLKNIFVDIYAQNEMIARI